MYVLYMCIVCNLLLCNSLFQSPKKRSRVDEEVKSLKEEIEMLKVYSEKCCSLYSLNDWVVLCMSWTCMMHVQDHVSIHVHVLCSQSVYIAYQF